MDPVTKRWMPRFTKEHQRAQEKYEAIDKERNETQSARDELAMPARLARRNAERLEAEFKAKVDEMERSGKPDPNPDQTRALANEMDKAAEAADRAEQALSDAEAANQKVMIKWRAAGDELRDAGNADPVINDYREEHQREMDKDRSSLVDPIADPDDAQVAAASTDDMGSSLLADGVEDGFVGDEGEDSELATVGESDQLTGSSFGFGSSALAETGGDLSGTAGDSQLASADLETPGVVESAGDPAGGDSWVDEEQTDDSQMAVTDPPAQQEFEEFADDGAGTPS